MTVIGVISDTHLPQRYRELPQRVFDLFADVDIILHAGDVGSLGVIDQLSALAPVVAVHGNDEGADCTAALPYLQVVSAAETRLVLTHAHYPDRAAERASRTSDWLPKLERRAHFAQQHAASICVFGHLHIPMWQQHNGIWLLNPGAIAGGKPWQRQRIQTVALLTLEPDQPPQCLHIDLATGQPHTPVVATRQPFEVGYAHYEELIVTDAVLPLMWPLWDALFLHDEPRTRRFIETLGYPCWHEGRETITLEDIRALLRDDDEAQATLREIPELADLL